MESLAVGQSARGIVVVIEDAVVDGEGPVVAVESAVDVVEGVIFEVGDSIIVAPRSFDTVMVTARLLL